MGSSYQDLCDLENLYLAYRRARRGKRDKEIVARFERNLELELITLQDVLLNQTYLPGSYTSFYRTESKRRLISAAPFRDRVVHHALLQIIEPTFERAFIFDSYANRKGKGTHQALDRCTQFLRSSQYVLQCDIRQFFPSVDHAILRTELNRHISDEQVLWLCDQILNTGIGVLAEVYKMHYFPGDDLFAGLRPRGLPLGNLTSQFWANVYLNPLDQFIKRNLKYRRYLRFVDDFLLFADEKSILHAWKSQIIHFLIGLRLTLHENAAQIRPVAEGLPFLGFIVFPDHRRIKSMRGHTFQRRFHRLFQRYTAGLVAYDALAASLRGWIAHAEHGDTWALRQSILKPFLL